MIGLLTQFSLAEGVIALRRHFPLREGAVALDGLWGRFEALWMIELDDSRYPNEWAMRAITGDAKDKCDELGIPWIASGDIAITALTLTLYNDPNYLPTLDFGARSFAIGELPRS